MADVPRDSNYVPALALESSTNPGVIVSAKGNEATGRLLVDLSGGGSGSVTTVSVVTANGLAGSVADATTTPAITLSTTITGILSGNGTAISAASTTGSGPVVLATSPTLTTPTLGVATATSLNGLTITGTTGTLTLTNAKTLAATNSLTLSGTDGTVMTFPTTSATLARTDAANTFTGVQTMTSPSITTSIVTGSASFDAFNTTATTLNIGGAATTLTIGGTPTTAVTHNYSTNATAAATTKTVNIGTGGAASSTTNVNIGSSNGGTTTINSTALTVGTTGTFTTGTIELGDASDTTLSRSAAGVLAVEGVVIPSISSTNTLTNKFITPQVQSVADAGGTLTPVSITNDMAIATALSQATTIAAPTGSPVQGERLVIRLKDNGTARALTWNAIYRASSDLALPTTTILSKTLYCGFIYNSTDTKWDLVAYLNNF